MTRIALVFFVVVAACGGATTTSTPSDPAKPDPVPAPRPSPTWPLPDGWRTEIIPFPLGFAPTIEHRGLEEIRFAPGFFDREAPGYWSYAFVWRLDDPADLTAAALGTELTTYFRGLVAAVDGDKKRVDPTTIVVHASASGATFSLVARVFDVFGDANPIDLTGTAERRPCPDNGSLWIVTFTPNDKPTFRPQLADLARSAACGQTPVEPPPKPKQ
jgi:hypothetical protein